MTRLFKPLSALLGGTSLLIGVAAFFFYSLSGQAVEFESLESLTEKGGPVYNRVRFERRGQEDLWLMQQSQRGPSPPHERWDRLAILVNRETRTSRFYQLEPGPLAFTPGAKEIAFRVACYLCHANGPRAIRPNRESITHRLSWKENLALLLMNARISAYGSIAPSEDLLAPSKKFAARSSAMREPLRLKACASCHSGEARGRAVLLRQHFMPIGFLVKSGQMPPNGGKLSARETAELHAFLSGLL